MTENRTEIETEYRRPPVTRQKRADLGAKIKGGEKLLFEKSRKGAVGVRFPAEYISDDITIPENLRRESLELLPELCEFEVVRHFSRLSKLNASLDEHCYPLGSCTMKYNPRVNEAVVRLPGFAKLHPHTPKQGVKGAFEVMRLLGETLLHLTGEKGITFAPAAGAHGELAGIMMMKKALERDGSGKDVILIPDTAHGTNPATCTMIGLKTKNVPSGEKGVIEVKDILAAMDEKVGGIMITNPNTLGIFESNIEEICKIIHDAGGYVYMDGANLNALLGKGRAGDFGVDALHINLHKTFSQPHGGGGPGAGPVVVSDRLAEFLPPPSVILDEEGRGEFRSEESVNSVGKMREFAGNFGVFVRSLAYCLRLGGEGMRALTEAAVLNANYLRKELEGHYHLAYSQPHLHEAVFSDKLQKQNGIDATAVAKRLLDYGFHPPTVHFPLTVKGALMIEPTETESKNSIDSFIDSMREIAVEAKETPEIFAEAPYTTPVSRLDETRAARNPVLKYEK